jgi:hypothetical protein
MTDPSQRRPKKSESIEVRLPHELKQDFLAACEAEKRTVSDKVRGWIEVCVAEWKQPAREPRAGRLIAMMFRSIRKRRYFAAGAGLAGLALVFALPSAAKADLRASFERLDKNGDGVITAAEFLGDHLPVEAVVDTRRTIRKDAAATADTGEERVQLRGFGLLQPTDGAAPNARWGVSLNLGVRVASWEAGPDGERTRVPPEHPLAYAFVDMDANQDDRISFAEYRVRFQTFLSRGFALLDEDGDGLLTEAEFANSDDEDMLSARQMGAAPDCGGEPCKPRSRLSDEVLAAGFSLLDTNGDGRIALAEYLSET